MYNNWNNFDLFTDRFDLIKLFLSYLNGSIAERKIIFLYGDGGNGKSFLIRYLKRKYCIKLPSDIWNNIKVKDDEEFIEELNNIFKDKHIKNNIINVHSLLLDFNTPVLGSDNPQERLSSLLMIRRMIKLKGCHFHIFDLAYIQYLLINGEYKESTIKKVLPDIEINLLTGIIDMLITLPIVSLIVSVFKKIFANKIEERIVLPLKGIKVDNKLIEEIKRFEFENKEELILNLPKYLALDINNFLKSDKKGNQLVLFFDTHESFWGDKLSLSDFNYHEKDQWLRAFLEQLDISNRVTVVIAGRNKPKWELAHSNKIPTNKLEIKHIDFLEKKYAVDYLSKSDINHNYWDIVLLNVLNEDDLAHPILLTLYKDLILVKQQNNQIIKEEDFDLNIEQNDKIGQVFSELLKCVDQDTKICIQVLSASRFFDKELFKYLSTKFGFVYTERTFQKIIEFSFIGKGEKVGLEYFKIHDLIRKIFNDSKDSITYKAHTELEIFYREKIVNNKLYITNVIYHRVFNDKDGAIKEWTLNFKESMGNSDNTLCEALLNIVKYFDIDDCLAKAEIVSLNAQYLVDFCRYEEATYLYKRAIDIIDMANPDFLSFSKKGEVLSFLGCCYCWRSDLEISRNTCYSAIKYLNKSISLNKNYVDSYTNKGFALEMIGDAYYYESNYNKAVTYYKQAISACHQSIRIQNNNPDAELNLAYAYLGLGDVYLSQHQLNKSRIYFTKSVQTNISIKKGNVDDKNGRKNSAISNIAYGWIGIGEAQFYLADYTNSLIAFKNCLSILNDSLKETPNSLYIIDNLLYANCMLSGLYISLDDYKNAFDFLRRNISIEKKIQKTALSDSIYFLNIGLTYFRLGEIKYKKHNNRKALDYLNQAINHFNNSLLLDPNEDISTKHKSSTFMMISLIYFDLHKKEETETNINNSVNLINELIRKSPLNHEYITQKGDIILRFVDKLIESKDYIKANTLMKVALKSLTKSIKINSNYIPSINNISICFYYYGRIDYLCNKFDKALFYFNQSIEQSEKALKITKNRDIVSLHYKTLANFYLGEIINKKESLENAKEYYINALDLIKGIQKSFPFFKELDNHQGVITSYLKN